MFPQPKSCSRKRAFTMIEVIMTSAMLILLSLVTIGGMIAHARMAKSNMAFQRMAEQARVLTDGVQVASMDATLIRLGNGPGGTNSVVTFGRPDPTNASNTLFVQYAFLDDDNSSATIRDNRIVRRTVDTPNSTDGETVLSYCNPVNATVFSVNNNGAKPLYNLSLRVGDQSFPANNTDNAVTGPGTQAFNLNTDFCEL